MIIEVVTLASKLSYQEAANQLKILHPNRPLISFTKVCTILTSLKAQ